MELTKYKPLYTAVTPKLLRQLSVDGSLDVKTGENKKAVVEGTEFSFSEVPPGSDIILFIENRFFVYALQSDYEQYLEAKKEAYNKKLLEQKNASLQLEKKIIDSTAQFYQAYNLPVAAAIGHVGHLSALTPNSGGNGVTRGTVNHLLAAENFDDKNIRRVKGQMLCLAEGKDYADSNSNPVTAYMPEHDISIVPTVTCAACLKIMQRWKKTA